MGIDNKRAKEQQRLENEKAELQREHSRKVDELKQKQDDEKKELTRSYEIKIKTNKQKADAELNELKASSSEKMRAFQKESEEILVTSQKKLMAEFTASKEAIMEKGRIEQIEHAKAIADLNKSIQTLQADLEASRKKCEEYEGNLGSSSGMLEVLHKELAVVRQDLAEERTASSQW